MDRKTMRRKAKWRKKSHKNSRMKRNIKKGGIIYNAKKEYGKQE